MARNGSRDATQLRTVEIIPGFLELHPASCLIKMGRTWVLCAASVEERVPFFLDSKGQGWVTAEYGMLPASTNQRTQRERQNSGRSQEISRLIGRCLRASIDMKLIGQRTVTIDCDVIQADGGTRTASITGGYVALALAARELMTNGTIRSNPLKQPVAAVSAGIVDGELLLDLDYSEDSRAEADLNVAMSETGELVEVQGTAEGRAFPPSDLQRLVGMSWDGIKVLLAAQREALEKGA